MNLSHDQMKVRCPTAIPVGPRKIFGYKVVMNRYATLVEDPLCSVWGGCWKIDKECEEQLDWFEGYPSFYRKIEVHGMMTYQMTEDHYLGWKPSLGYIESILQGLEDFGLYPREILARNLNLEMNEFDLSKICEVY